MHSLHCGRGRIQYRFTSGHFNVGVSSYCLTGRSVSAATETFTEIQGVSRSGRFETFLSNSYTLSRQSSDR